MAPRTRRTTAAAAAAAANESARLAAQSGRPASVNTLITKMDEEMSPEPEEREMRLENAKEETRTAAQRLPRQRRPRIPIRRWVEREVPSYSDDDDEAEQEQQQDGSGVDDSEVEVEVEDEDEDEEDAQSVNGIRDVEVLDEDEEDELLSKPKQNNRVGGSKPPSTSHVRSQPSLRIKLKLPQNAVASSSNSTGTTPDDGDIDMVSPVKSGRRPRRVLDEDIESEDPTSPSVSEEEADERESESVSISRSAGPGTPSGAGMAIRPMTTRQAVLASVVDSSHVSLDEGSRSKKQPLTEMELALRREETARKRKNLSEKKLEDEKAETINRLLKKQSRPRARKVNTTDDRSPLPNASTRLANRTPKGYSTPITKMSAGDEAGAEVETGVDGEEDEDGMDVDVLEGEIEVKPTMFRWVSKTVLTTGTDLDEMGDAMESAENRRMVITLSVPTTLYPAPRQSTPSAAIATTSTASAENMQIDGARAIPPPEEVKSVPEKLDNMKIPGRGPGTCAIEGCGQSRKYRLVKDWTVGACGLGHLKMLEARVQ